MSQDYDLAFLQDLPFDEVFDAWSELISTARAEKDEPAMLAALGRQDRYFLLVELLAREDAVHPWLYEQCRAVEAATDGYLDLWARGHYKSTIITFAGVIQEILKNPEITCAIFSHTRPIAKAFLVQIKQEFERNARLIALYPDVLYDSPKKESPRWSEDGGIIVKRTSNPKESTLDAWGLVDGQPISKHYELRGWFIAP